ncbi:MAG: nucleotide exchange factor GrpE [Pseudomonadota bacterium]|nr:nucleotide exchange factor GrpE [Pseudomonadota bacterium]
MTDENEMKPAPETAPEAEAAMSAAEVETNDELGALRIQLATVTDEAAALKDRLIRAMADLENTRKRAEREREDALKFGATRFARDMCEVADNLSRAIDAAPSDSQDEALKGLLEGVSITQAALRQIFERHGVKLIEAEGAKFDPNLHEALTEVEVPGAEPGTCIQVVQAGYTIQGRLLRPARVIVARASQAAAGNKVDTSA